MIGAPMATPSAYPLISQPASGMLTRKSFATLGNSPMMTNSVVPIANALSASASSETGIKFPVGLFIIVSAMLHRHTADRNTTQITLLTSFDGPVGHKMP